MKSGYFLYIELISNKKFQKDQLADLKSQIEENEDFVIFSDLLVEGLDLNFSSHVEIYVEDQPFESDISLEVEKLIPKIESLIPGGWSKDSKIEWISEITSQSSIVWYRDDEKWKSFHKPLERDITDEDVDWENYEPPTDYYSNYDDDY